MLPDTVLAVKAFPEEDIYWMSAASIFLKKYVFPSTLCNINRDR